MKLYKLLFFLLFLTLISCQNAPKKQSDNPQDITHKPLTKFQFKGKKAAKLNQKGIRLSKNKHYKSGRAVFIKALKIEPDNPITLSNLGLNRYLAYDYENAIRYYKKSYNISDSTYHTAAVNLALAYYYKKESRKGIEIASYVIDNTMDKQNLAVARVHRALNYLGINDCQKAKVDLRYIIKNIKNIQYHIRDLKGK